MNRRIFLLAYSIGGLVIIMCVFWLAHTYRIDAHVAAFFQPRKKLAVETSIADATLSDHVATSSESKMREGNDPEQTMNEYWLSRINALRAQKNLKPLTFDARLASTANIWANHMGSSGVLAHDRPNGESVHEWIADYHLPFADRGPDGWTTNYFTENIGRAYAGTSTESLRHALDQVLDSMASEAPDGDHYRTIFSPDWNSYGGGFYFSPVGDGRFQVYMAFHYARLQ